ncbi:MAG TPA: hypothetical protein VEZ89_10005, partial [Rubrivivax sp.]|nr:hypothetical protein [Rubrivivax sp.]
MQDRTDFITLPTDMPPVAPNARQPVSSKLAKGFGSARSSSLMNAPAMPKTVAKQPAEAMGRPGPGGVVGLSRQGRGWAFAVT